MPRTAVIGAARTPFGRLGGGLASLSAPELGTHAAAAALSRSGVAPEEIGYVVMGQVLQAGAGQIPSRQVSAGIGLPRETGSETINKVCASGMRAAAIGDIYIRAGEYDVVLAGGMESMSNAPYLLPKARFGYKLGDGTLVDSMTSDGLTCTFDGKIMALQNSDVSTEIGIGREQQDAWALRSHQRAVAAIDSGKFADEIAPVTIPGRKGDTVVEHDEGPRRDTSAERLAGLKPVFSKDGATTAGNAPGRERRRRRDGAGVRGLGARARPHAACLHPVHRARGRRLRLSGPDAGRIDPGGAREGRTEPWLTST